MNSDERDVMGIIPAYAGSTRAFMRPHVRNRDHPRVCGEHVDSIEPIRAGEGSSPRMRGAQRDGTRWVAPRGIIPAYAGSTNVNALQMLKLQDHPRVCGEHLPFVNHSSSFAGSSPRMRGARSMSRQCTAAAGIIPAYAGSTVEEVPAAAAGEDHPRVCGEHPHLPECFTRCLGSSPRMRGALIGEALFRAIARIIPAYAGSTIAWRLP